VATSSSTPFLTLTKSFNYRGARELFANIYHFDTTPPSSAAWSALVNAVWALEANLFPTTVQLESATGHTPGTPPVLAYEADPAPAGPGGPAAFYTPAVTEHPVPGDCAAWIRYSTTQKTSRGKPIYLRNYYHAIFYDTSSDLLSALQKPTFDALGTAMVNGILADGITYHRAGPRGAVAQGHMVGPNITTRTLKARGKRHRIDLNSPAARKFLEPYLPPIAVP